MERQNLMECPERICNVDETGFNTEHRPPMVVGNSDNTEQYTAITSSRGFNTTVISCVSAAGQVLPPYFVFKGE